MAYKVISFDGGGIRGLITALLLKDLFGEDAIGDQADMLAGTSTGSFIALGLAKGVTVEAVVNLYKGGAAFFHVPDFCWDCVWKELGITDATMQQQISSGEMSGFDMWASGLLDKIKNIFVAAYDTSALAPALQGKLGDRPLNELSKHVAVNTLQLWQPKSNGSSDMEMAEMSSGQWRARTIGSASEDPFSAMKAYQAALCSGAAPTYFPPFNPDGFDSYFVDGGLFANNPSASAISYALKHKWAQLEDIRMLSIGTGHTTLGIPPSVIRDPQCWGGYQWMRPSSRDAGTVPAMPLVEAALSASADACGEYASMMLGQGGVGKDGRYWRLNCDLKKPIGLADWEKIKEMEDLVTTFIGTNQYLGWKQAFLEYWNS